MIYLPHHCPNTTIYNFWIHHSTNLSLIRFVPPESPTPRRHQTCSNFAVPAKIDIVLVAVCPFLAILPKSKSESLKKQDLLFACFNSYVLPIASSVLLTDWRHQFWSATYCDWLLTSITWIAIFHTNFGDINWCCWTDCLWLCWLISSRSKGDSLDPLLATIQFCVQEALNWYRSTLSVAKGDNFGIYINLYY